MLVGIPVVGLVQDRAMRFEHRIDIARGPARVIGHRPGGAPDDVDVRSESSPDEAVSESAKGEFQSGPIQQRCPHATLSSYGAMKIPRLRKVAAACTVPSARAAGVLKGNQKRRSGR